MTLIRSDRGLLGRGDAAAAREVTHAEQRHAARRLTDVRLGMPELGVVIGLGAPGHAGVDRLFAALCVLCGAVIVVLGVLVVGYCVRYRAGSSADRAGIRPQMTWLEIGWLGATLVVFVAIGGWANVVFYSARAAPPEAYTIYVIGKQWMWKAEHPSGRREIDELHVPVGEPVRVVLASNDVIHSFSIPDLRVKQDAVPGRYTSVWFNAAEPGRHHLFCAQYCGSEHSGMTGEIIAMSRDDFARWLSDRPLEEKTPGMPGTERAPQHRGEAIFYRVGCSACHMQTGSVLAPRLDGLWGRPTKLTSGREVIVDENYIRESIVDPNARIVAGYAAPSLMPSFAGVLSEEDLVDLVEFIKSIRYGWPGASDDAVEKNEAGASGGETPGRKP